MSNSNSRGWSLKKYRMKIMFNNRSSCNRAIITNKSTYVTPSFNDYQVFFLFRATTIYMIIYVQTFFFYLFDCNLKNIVSSWIFNGLVIIKGTFPMYLVQMIYQRYSVLTCHPYPYFCTDLNLFLFASQITSIIQAIMIYCGHAAVGDLYKQNKVTMHQLLH